MSKETYLNGKKVKRIYLGPRVVKKLYLGTNMVYTIVPTVDINQMKDGTQSSDLGTFQWRKNNDAWSENVGDEWFPESENRLILDDVIQLKNITPSSGNALQNVTKNDSVVTPSNGIYTIPLTTMNEIIKINYIAAGPATVSYGWNYKGYPCVDMTYDEFVDGVPIHTWVHSNYRDDSPAEVNQGETIILTVDNQDTSLKIDYMQIDDGQKIYNPPYQWTVNKNRASLIMVMGDASGCAKLYSPYSDNDHLYFLGSDNVYVGRDHNEPYYECQPHNILRKSNNTVYTEVKFALRGPSSDPYHIAANSCVAKIPAGFCPHNDFTINNGLHYLHFTSDGYGNDQIDSERDIPLRVKKNGDMLCTEAVTLQYSSSKGGNRDYKELQLTLPSHLWQTN